MSKYKIAGLIALAAMLLPFSQVFAADLDVLVFPQQDIASGKFKQQHVLGINYDGGKLQEIFAERDTTIEFTADSNVQGVKELIDRLNQALLDANSPARFEDVTVMYKARVSGDESTGLIDLAVTLDFRLTDIVISGDTASPDGAQTDLNWRGIKVDGPVVLNVPEVGEIDINSIKGFLQAVDPEIAEVLESSGAGELISKPVLDFTDYKELPLDRWHSSFDASFGVAEAEKYGISGDVPKVVTTLAKGESSLREGQVLEEVFEADLSIDGSTAKARLTIPPAYASVKIAGYATIEANELGEFAMVTDNPPAGKQVYSSGGLPVMVITIFAAMAGAIAGFVFWKARPKPQK